MYIKNQFLRLRMMIMKKCLGESRYVLVTLSGGLIDQVKFYDDAYMALMNLADYVKSMDPEDSDAVIYGPDGMVANAKLFMDNSEDGADNGRQTGNEKGGIFLFKTRYSDLMPKHRIPSIFSIQFHFKNAPINPYSKSVMP